MVFSQNLFDKLSSYLSGSSVNEHDVLLEEQDNNHLSHRVLIWMERTLQILNSMQTEGLFHTYAICGGIAALFYIEPITTKERLIKFLDEWEISPKSLNSILEKHHLKEKFERFRRQHYGERL